MPDNESKFSELRQFAAQTLKSYQVPGAAIAVFAEGQEFAAGFGVTNVRHPLEVNETTIFQIGSITKTFTATLAMQLVEAGKLDLDAPIRRYLPNFQMSDPEVTERVTVRHLLTHTGGWEGDLFEDTGNGDDALAIYVERMAHLPQLTQLGSMWSYNNSAFSLAGRVVEVLSGTSYEAALAEQLLRPLGLRRSFIFATDVMTHRFAVGHGAPGIVLTPWPLTRSAFPAGGIASTVMDMIRYGRFHLCDDSIAEGTRVLSHELIKEMQKVQIAASLDSKQGIGWGIEDSLGLKWIAHGGGTLGQISTLMVCPERQFVIAMTTNSGAGGMFIFDTFRWALDNFLGTKLPEPRHISVDAAELSVYVGRYRSTLTDFDFRIENGGLVGEMISRGGFPKRDSPPGPPQPPIRVGFTKRDRVIGLDPPFQSLQAEFLRNQKGGIEWFRFGRLHQRLPQDPSTKD